MFILPLLSLIIISRWQLVLLDALIAATVFLYTDISLSLSELLFKYTPESINDIFHPVNLMQLLMNFLILMIIIHIVSLKSYRRLGSNRNDGSY